MEDPVGRRAYQEWLAQRPGPGGDAGEDPDRPRYHFLPEPGWMNDPVPVFAGGAYHVFFQYRPGLPFWGDIHWGHACSPDLVHWRHLPPALAPTPEGPDAGGCWTGCVVEAAGAFHALYTGVEPLVQCLASSADLLTWVKDPGNPVLGAEQRPAGGGETCRDPCVWRQDGLWFMVLGADLPGGGGRPLLYRSPDLRRWEYLHPLYAGPLVRDECPDLFPLGGRHVLLSSRDHSAWAVGTFADLRFAPVAAGELDRGQLYAVKTLLEPGGRRLAWGWVREARPVPEQVRAGWSGVLSLPRVLTLLPDGTVGAEPPAELAALRGEGWEPACPDLGGSSAGRPAVVEVPASGCFELWADFTALAAGASVGLLLPGAAAVSFGAGRGAFAGGAGSLRVFVDRSVVEVFVDGRETWTGRAYRAAGGGAPWVGLWAEGGRGALRRLRLWDLAPRP